MLGASYYCQHQETQAEDRAEGYGRAELGFPTGQESAHVNGVTGMI